MRKSKFSGGGSHRSGRDGRNKSRDQRPSGRELSSAQFPWMNPNITRGTPIERLFEVAGEAGSSGGKLCGAGGGGYLLLACPPETQPAVREALDGLGGQFADFAFRRDGAEARRGDLVWRPA